MDYRGLDFGTGIGNLSNTLAQGYKDRLDLQRQDDAIARQQAQLAFEQHQSRLNMSRYGTEGVDAAGNPTLMSSAPLNFFDPRPDQATQFQNTVNTIDQAAPRLKSIGNRLFPQRTVPAMAPYGGVQDDAQIPLMMQGMDDGNRSPAGGRTGNIQPTSKGQETGLTPEQLQQYREASIKQLGGRIEANGTVSIPAHALDRYEQFMRPYLAQGDQMNQLAQGIINRLKPNDRVERAPAQPRVNNGTTPEERARNLQIQGIDKEVQAINNEISKPSMDTAIAIRMKAKTMGVTPAEYMNQQQQRLLELKTARNQLLAPSAASAPKAAASDPMEAKVQEFMKKKGVDRATAERSIQQFLQGKKNGGQ